MEPEYSFLGRMKKERYLKIAEEQNQGSDKLFFQIYAQVAESEVQDEED